ncbi:MAG: hypothetical protein Q8N63_05095 [Nanoarchaeota archaeon]|nr:hypothetical protein [Nanoarchaeota archaeon]
MNNRVWIFLSVFAGVISVIFLILITNPRDSGVNERPENSQPSFSIITVKVLTVPMITIGDYSSSNYLTFMAEEVRGNNESNISSGPLLCYSRKGEGESSYMEAATLLEYARTKEATVRLRGGYNSQEKEGSSRRFEVYSVSVSTDIIIIKK